MSEWTTIRLGSVVRTNTTSYSPKEGWKYVNYLDTGNITENVIDAIHHIDLANEKLPSRAKRKVQMNSILYSTVRPNQKHFGIIKSMPKNFLVSTGFAVIDVIPEKADADYLYFWLTQNTVVEQLHAIAEQSVSAYPSIKASDIENLEIALPPLTVQKSIASILKSISDKMSHNSSINENLEHQSLALFSNYYEQSNTEIDFTDLIQVLGGGTPKTRESTYWNGNIPFFTPKDVSFPYTLATEKTITEDGLIHCNSRLYPVNTVFVTARGTVGKVGIAGVPMAMNQSCYALIGKGIHQLLVYFYTLKAIDRLKHKASGAVFDAIITKDFETEQVFKLSPNDTDTFIRIVEPMYQSILNNSIEKQRLIALRDSLLPKLMSGEIEVSKLDI